MTAAPAAVAPVNAMTVDVEDYFQVEAFAGTVPRDTWERFERRVEASTERVLAMLATAGVRATFFTLGWVAERHPALIHQIVAGGHELASHGYGHARVDTLTGAEFRADIVRARGLLEDLGGVAVTGYRAPTFSVGPRTPWAYDELARAGYRYSSSLYPIRHDLYGAPDAPRFPYRPGGGIVWEMPMATLRLSGHNLPCSGGGYFRLLPYALFRAVLRRYQAAERQPGMFYFHPWEIDPGQPRIAGVRPLSRFRHYVNLARTAPRLERLLRDFAWDRLDRVHAALLSEPATPVARAA